MKVALALHRIGLRGSLMHSLGIGSILAAISLWGRSAAVSDKDLDIVSDERRSKGNAARSVEKCSRIPDLGYR